MFNLSLYLLFYISIVFWLVLLDILIMCHSPCRLIEMLHSLYLLLCCCFFLPVWNHLSWSPESWLIKSTEAQTVKQKWCRIRAGHQIYMRLYVYLFLFTVSCHFEDLAEVQGIVFVCMFLKCFFVMVCRSTLEYWWLQYKSCPVTVWPL